MKVFQKRAERNIKELFVQAEKIPEFADKYVSMAMKLSTKNNVVIPADLKKKFCKHCKKYFGSSKDVRVRTTDKTLLMTCLSCNKQMRYPLA